jgi:hypothetical protein
VSVHLGAVHGHVGPAPPSVRAFSDAPILTIPIVRANSPRAVTSRNAAPPRRAIALLAAAALLFAPAPSHGEEVTVPASLQATLLAKVLPYDRNFPDRVRQRVQVLLVTRPENPDSVHVVSQLRAALGRLPDLGGLPHDELVFTWAGAPHLARACRSRRIAVVVFGPGFHDDLSAIREALAGIDVLSVAAVPDYVPLGIVLGFDVVSGRPKLLVNLQQARRQNVELAPEVLKFMKVYE